MTFTIPSADTTVLANTQLYVRRVKTISFSSPRTEEQKTIAPILVFYVIFTVKNTAVHARKEKRIGADFRRKLRHCNVGYNRSAEREDDENRVISHTQY